MGHLKLNFDIKSFHIYRLFVYQRNYKIITSKLSTTSMSKRGFCLEIYFDSTKSNLCFTFYWTLSLGIIIEGATKALPFKLVSARGINC